MIPTPMQPSKSIRKFFSGAELSWTSSGVAILAGGCLTILKSIKQSGEKGLEENIAEET